MEEIIKEDILKGSKLNKNFLNKPRKIKIFVANCIKFLHDICVENFAIEVKRVFVNICKSTITFSNNFRRLFLCI